MRTETRMLRLALHRWKQWLRADTNTAWRMAMAAIHRAERRRKGRRHSAYLIKGFGYGRRANQPHLERRDTKRWRTQET